MLAITLIIFHLCQTTHGNKVTNLENAQIEIFALDNVEYLFFGYEVTFDEACIICINYKGQLAILNTKEKAEFATKSMTNIFELGEFWIGARSNKKDLWYWIDNNKKLKLDHTFLDGFRLWDPADFVSNADDSCLTIYQKRHNIPTFIPLQCSKKRPFICEREVDKFRIETKEIDIIKVDNGEYILYSAKATWAEAVVYCRLKNLQIAEIISKSEARIVATSMLKARPDEMENAWIGGHLKNNVWKWVASNNNIEVNELWTNNSNISTGCLLLDRHICKDPIYISSNCDRKRNIICQKTGKKLISKTPIPIEVDGCPYWIGIYPLDWLEARKACLAINASLIILDSAEIINHMMNLMADYKHELRHIWTDGYRRRNVSKEETNQDNWYWESSGNLISESNFIPWCPDYDSNEYENCLNLDRDNRKTPVVYGLNCKRNQTYVCQPWKGHCVSHRVQDDLLMNSDFLNLYSGLADMKPVKTPAIVLSQNSSRETEEENVPFLYEDVSNMKKFHSTESYYSSSVSYAIPQQVNFLMEEATAPVIKEISARFGSEHIFEDDEKISSNGRKHVFESTEVNATNSLNFITELFSLQFTLPSLPQFGIRVVSAEDASPKSEVNSNFKESSFPKKLINDFQNHDNVSTFKQSAITTEEIKTVPGGLYGENFDYDDAPSSRLSEIMEKTTESTNYKESVKSNESLINNMAANITQDLNISAILQEVIEEELKLMNQQNIINESFVSERKSFTNLYSENTSKPQNEIENNVIPPYYAIESPLSVEFNEDADNFAPALRILDQTDDEERETQISITDKTADNFDFDSLKIDPYDKDSMLQLGRVLKSMFADKTSNAQTINFNLISHQNLPEEILQTDTSRSMFERNYIQRDTKGQKKYYTETITSTSSSPSTFHSTENLGCQSGQSFSSAQQPCGQTPVLVPLIQLIRPPQIFSSAKPNTIENENGSINQRSTTGTKNYQKSLFNIFKNLVNGVRIDIKEIKLKSYVRKFVKEKLSNLTAYDFGKKSETSWHKSFKTILNLLNGTTVRFHGERVQLRIASFAYKKQPFSQEEKIKREMKIKSFNDRKNSFNLNDHSSVKNKLNAKQKNTYEKERKSKDFKSDISSRGHKTFTTKNKIVKKSINEENLFSSKSGEDSIKGFNSIRVRRALKIENASEMVSIYFILKQPDSNDSIPILELHIRMPASSNPNKESTESRQIPKNTNDNHDLKFLNQDSRIFQSLRRRTIEKLNSAEEMEKVYDQKLSENKKKKLGNKENHVAFNYKKANDFMKNIISNVTSFRSISDLRRKRQLLFLVLNYLKHITDERQKKTIL